MPRERLIHAGRFLHFLERDGWEFVRRGNASAVVAVVARTDEDAILVVEQHRRPLDARVLELPAGLVGDDGDHDLLAAAQRELIEETGYRAGQLAVIGRGPSSAGLCDEIITLVGARGLERVGPGGGVDGEDITVHAVPHADAEGWLLACQEAGLLIDPKVWAGLYLFTSLR